MRRWLVLLVLVAVACAVLGRVMWQSWRGREVRVVAVTKGRVVAAVYATGRVDTDRRVTLRARVAGPLAQVFVGSGETVSRGEVVARQDDLPYRLAREKASRDVDAARASLAELEDTAKRAERLAVDDLIAEDALIKARKAVEQQRAVVHAREVDLRMAEEQEGWAVLRSPLAGVVSELIRRAGDPLREGDDVMTIVDLSDSYVRVSVDERDAGRVRPAQEVRMAFDAYPAQVLTGRVWRLVPSVDRLTKSSDVLVSLPPDHPPLQLSLTATVNIITDVVDNALVVPRDALEGSGSERAVYVVGPDRHAVRRSVAVGECDESRCQLVHGLTAGEAVISPLPAGLQPGARVHVS